MPKDDWLSAHIVFGDGATSADLYGTKCDRLIVGVVGPFAEQMQSRGLIRRYFYVRYAERDQHVRLRMEGPLGPIESEVLPHLQEFVATEYPDGAVRVCRGQYSPEYDRYGGLEGVELAEKVFCLTSGIAVNILRSEDAGDARGSRRLGKAALASLVLSSAFIARRAEAALFFLSYADGYLGRLAPDLARQRKAEFDNHFQAQERNLTVYVGEAWARIENDEPITPLLDKLRAGVTPVADELQHVASAGRLAFGGDIASPAAAVWSIVPSYIHMMNNRLGIPIAYEAYVARLVGHALQTDCRARVNV